MLWQAVNDKIHSVRLGRLGRSPSGTFGEQDPAVPEAAAVVGKVKYRKVEVDIGSSSTGAGTGVEGIRDCVDTARVKDE